MMTHALTSREEFDFLADLVLRHSAGDHTVMSLTDTRSGTTRFANNHLIQNVDARRVVLSVTVAQGGRRGTASTTDLTAGAVQETVVRAERIARVSPVDPEFMPPLGPQVHAPGSPWREDTSAAGPAGRLAAVAPVLALCRGDDVSGAGIVTSGESVVGLATSAGLRVYEPRTEARFSLTVTDGDSTGWAANAHRSIDRLGIAERSQIAIGKARTGLPFQELPPGRYTVILEPAAVAGLLTWMIWQLDAKAYHKATSPYAGRLRQRIIDARLNLHNLPSHPDLLGRAFNTEGLPCPEALWIEDGVLTQLAYDRFTALAHGVAPMPLLDAPCLTGDGAVEDLISTTARGILVTNFWYLRVVNPTDLTLTGMTRDGTFLIEDGTVRSALRNFRFHESPLRAFSNLEDCTHPAEAATAETGKLLVPSMRIRDFPFSSVTRF